MQAYRTWLGFYKGFLKQMKWDAARLVQEGTRYSAILGVGPLPHEGIYLYRVLGSVGWGRIRIGSISEAGQS
jgi:hypothetical protein